MSGNADNTNSTSSTNNTDTTNSTNNSIKGTTTGSPSKAISMDMTLFKKVITATYDVSTTTSADSKTVTTKALVMPGSIKPGFETDGLTISEFFAEIEKIVQGSNGIDKSYISDQIKSAGNIDDNDLDKISIVLKEIFFYYQSTKVCDLSAPVKTSNESPPSFEYAFDIEIKNNGFMKNDIFTINSLSFAIWNTTRKKIIDTMNLTNINDILNG